MTTSTGHRQSIDLARFLAAFGIVVAHAYVSPNDIVGHLSLSLFLILSAFLAASSAQRAGGSYDAWLRARRIAVPWLAWSAFYRALEMAFSDRPDRFLPVTDPWSLLYGSAIHLWFLPFIAMAGFLVQPVVRHINTPARLAMASAALAVAGFALLELRVARILPAPLEQWDFALPLYVLGLLVAVACRMRHLWIPTAAAAALSLSALWLSEGANWSWSALAALAAFGLFWRLPLRARWLPELGQAAFVIYLIHPFFMLVCYKFLGPGVNLFLAACLTFLMSLAAAMVWQRLPVLLRAARTC